MEKKARLLYGRRGRDASVGCGSVPAAPLHPLGAPLQFAGDSSDLQTSSLEDLAEPPAPVAADAPRDHHGPQGPGAARGRVVVTGK